MPVIEDPHQHNKSIQTDVDTENIAKDIITEPTENGITVVGIEKSLKLFGLNWETIEIDSITLSVDFMLTTSDPEISWTEPNIIELNTWITIEEFSIITEELLDQETEELFISGEEDLFTQEIFTIDIIVITLPDIVSGEEPTITGKDIMLLITELELDLLNTKNIELINTMSKCTVF